MAHPNEDLIRAFFAARARGDMQAWRECLAADVRWHYPGQGPLAGQHEGIDQMADVLGQVDDLSGGTSRHELHDVIGNDEHVVALHVTRAERVGRQLEINAAQVFHVRDGKITQAWTLHDDPHAVDEFWS